MNNNSMINLIIKTIGGVKPLNSLSSRRKSNE